LAGLTPHNFDTPPAIYGAFYAPLNLRGFCM
jgi:hypothetical protein